MEVAISTQGAVPVVKTCIRSTARVTNLPVHSQLRQPGKVIDVAFNALSRQVGGDITCMHVHDHQGTQS